MDVKKKILFIVPSMRGGGSERVISIILSYLSRENFELSLILLKKEGKYLDDLPDDIKIIDLDVYQARYALFKIILYINKIKPNIVFSTLGYLNILISIIRPFFPRTIKFVARESSIVSIQNKQEKYPKVFDYLYKIFYNNFDVIISQSNYMKNDLITNYKIDDKSIHVINNPVDVKKINKLSKTEEILFNVNKINLLAVGRLNKIKNFDKLIKIASKLDSKYHLTILGEGEEELKLTKLITEFKLDKNVTLKGFQKNPYKYMIQADVLLLTSSYEGFPNVLLESNICGTPIVAFNCPGGTNEIVRNGENGYLVKCNNLEDFFTAINMSTKFHWNKKEIIQHAVNKYSVMSIIKKYEKILDA